MPGSASFSLRWRWVLILLTATENNKTLFLSALPMELVSILFGLLITGLPTTDEPLQAKIRLICLWEQYR